MTCRTFGPPVRSGEEGGLAVCELCYHGASDQQIAACEMVPDPDNLEEKLIASIEKKTGKRGNTIVAWRLARSIQQSAISRQPKPFYRKGRKDKSGDRA